MDPQAIGELGGLAVFSGAVWYELRQLRRSQEKLLGWMSQSLTILLERSGGDPRPPASAPERRERPANGDARRPADYSI